MTVLSVISERYRISSYDHGRIEVTLIFVHSLLQAHRVLEEDSQRIGASPYHTVVWSAYFLLVPTKTSPVHAISQLTVRSVKHAMHCWEQDIQPQTVSKFTYI